MGFYIVSIVLAFSIALIYAFLQNRERSFEENSTEMRLTYGIKVSKDMQIKVESFTGELPGDIDTMPEAPEFEIK